jgi:hypothetical protein
MHSAVKINGDAEVIPNRVPDFGDIPQQSIDLCE